MSAGLEQFDWMMSAKERPWHGIGTVVEDAVGSADALRIAKLDWVVTQYPVSANGKEIPGVFANVRSDTNESLGVVKSRYNVLQNVDAFNFIDDIIENNSGTECKYETAGSLFNGRRVFMLVRLPNQKLVGDDVENYMFFTNSHDGTSSLLAGITNVRVVCNNTLQMAIEGASRTWKCHHTKNLERRKKEAAESLGLAVKYISQLDTTAQEMAMKKIDEEEFFRKLFDNEIEKHSEKRVKDTIEKIHLIYNEKDDLQNFRGTAWGMYNAVSDFVSNSVPQRETEFGSHRKLEKFFDGNRLLALTQEILVA